MWQRVGKLAAHRHLCDDCARELGYGYEFPGTEEETDGT